MSSCTKGDDTITSKPEDDKLVFSYDDLYKTVYELIQFAYDHSTYSDIINCYDVPKNLQNKKIISLKVQTNYIQDIH